MSQIDVTQLAKDLMPYLLPILPYFMETGKIAGTEAVKAVGKKFGEAASTVLQNLWKKLQPKVDETPTTKEAMLDLAKQPDDTRAQGALELQLEKILLGDETFRKEIAALLQDIKSHGIIITSELEIETHEGQLRVVDIEEAETFRESGVTQVNTQAKIKQTKPGSTTSGIHFGSVSGQNAEDKG